MKLQVFIILIGSIALSIGDSLPEDELKGRTFLWTYPSNTYPLSVRHKSIAKVRRRPLAGENMIHEEATEADLITEGTTESIETTTSYNDNEIKATTDRILMDIAEDYNFIDDEAIDEESNLIQVDLEEKKGEIYVSPNLAQNQQSREESERIEKSLLNSFPFDQQEFSNHHGHNSLDHHHHHHVTDDRSVLVNERATDILDQLSSTAPDSSGRRCIDKVMMREETEYDEVLTCDHSYDKRCHTSYITKFEPHQEQECDEKFRKVCTIEYEQKAVQELVEVCTTPFVKDCEVEGDDVCQTVYESECSTVQIVHQVEDDVPNCKTVEEKKCEDVTEGFETVSKCDTWPVEKCSLEKKLVKKYTPHTSCQKVPKEMCAPKGCGIKEGPVQCQDKVKTVVVDNPIEECDMEPLRTCKHITKLVPKLEAAQDCVDVPKEICARSKVNPRKVKKPSIQKWCFTPKNVRKGECQRDGDCSNDGFICEENACVAGCHQSSECGAGRICESKTCIPGCEADQDCPSGQSCLLNKCRVASGKVLLDSFTIKTLSCTGCSQESEGVTLSLQGERTVDFKDGYTCESSVGINHKDVEDFGSGGLARFDGSSDLEKSMMGDCFKAPLNAVVLGGSVTWVGEGQWTPSSICVDWESNDNFAYQCQLKKVTRTENTWQLEDCQADVPNTKCE